MRLPDCGVPAIIDGMGTRVLAWWEGLQGRTRVFVAIPIAFVALFVFHLAFPLLSMGDRALYAAMEAVPVALLAAWATQNELRRRAEREGQDPDTLSGGPPV
jgi:hypothetical protein